MLIDLDTLRSEVAARLPDVTGLDFSLFDLECHPVIHMISITGVCAGQTFATEYRRPAGETPASLAAVIALHLQNNLGPVACRLLATADEVDDHRLAMARLDLADRLPGYALVALPPMTGRGGLQQAIVQTPTGPEEVLVEPDDVVGQIVRRFARPAPAATPTDLRLLTQRVASRLPDVRGLVLTVDDGRLHYEMKWAENVVKGWVPAFTSVHVQAGVVAEDIAATTGTRLLAEVVLTDDTSVVLNGHALRIAERQQVVRAEPRVPRPPPSTAYAEADARADMQRLSDLIHEGILDYMREEFTYLPGGDIDDASARDRRALLVLSKLNAFRLGAPADTEGHRWARETYEAMVATDTTEDSDSVALEAPVSRPADTGGSGQPPHPTASVLDAPTRLSFDFAAMADGTGGPFPTLVLANGSGGGCGAPTDATYVTTDNGVTWALDGSGGKGGGT